MKSRNQTFEEEIANAITHGLGIVFTLAAMPFLLKKTAIQANDLQYWAMCLFGFGMLMVYTSSTLYHAVQQKTLKKKLNIWDHISIFFLQGGSYAPFVQFYCDADTAKIFLSAQWTIIIIGAILKLFFTGKYEKASIVLYIFLGWSAVFLIQPFYQNMPFSIFKWILVGGLSYTFGVFFYRWDEKKYAHAVWHIFVLFGTICHFIAAWKMLDI
jgi:hemolysin III